MFHVKYDRFDILLQGHMLLIYKLISNKTRLHVAYVQLNIDFQAKCLTRKSSAKFSCSRPPPLPQPKITRNSPEWKQPPGYALVNRGCPAD